MLAGSRGVAAFHIGWQANGDSLDVALVVNRALAAGGRAWWLPRGGSGWSAGDYLLELTPAQHNAIVRIGLRLAAWLRSIPVQAQALTAPVTCLFAGRASAFPYYAYYALCLLRLGVDYVACDGGALAGGALADANLLVLPGGFATWGIDRAEDAPGADAQVGAFLAAGGEAIGSCGGAFYLSMGRPGWTGTAAAKPLYSHEYLQTGVGVVDVVLEPGPLAVGCPPTIDVPYYHGPIYDALGPGVEVAARFHALSLSARLAIDNPLDHARFERDMAGKPAILVAAGERGRAVLFSPHPEMGDLIRKYIALDGYVRRYLPIRGFTTMRDTLRHYRVADAPSFRLVLNAVHLLMTTARPAGRRNCSAADGPLALDDVAVPCRRAFDALPNFGADDMAELLRDVAARLRARFDPACERATRVLAHAEHLMPLVASWRHLASTLAEHFTKPADRTPAQQMMELELAVALLECWTRVAETDLAIAGEG